MNNAQTLFERVREWGEAKGITGDHGRGTVMGQLGKVNEEIQELNDAIHDVDDDEIVDAIGDSIVTLIILADMLGYRSEDCLQSAYEVIAKRTGRMLNGTFVKDAP